MHPSISVNTLCFAPAPLDHQIEAVARLGARGISPDLEQILPFGSDRAARAIGDAGLRVATLTHRSFAFATAEKGAAGQDRLFRTIEAAVQIGAETIIMTTGGRGTLSWGAAADRFAETIAPCAEAALAAGVRLGIEPTSHLYADVSIAHRLADAVTLARKAGIGVMIDLFACWVDSDIDAAIAAAAPISPVVQVADYVYGDRGLPCRAVPGDGAIPLDVLVPAIVQGGFAGWFDLEIIGPRLQKEGEAEGLARAAERIGALLGAPA